MDQSCVFLIAKFWVCALFYSSLHKYFFNHSEVSAFKAKAVLNFSKDESRDKQNPLEAGISGKSGIFSPKTLKDSGPFDNDRSSSGVVLDEQEAAFRDIRRQFSILSIILEKQKKLSKYGFIILECQFFRVRLY